MNKFQVLIGIVLIGIVGILFVVSQKGYFESFSNTTQKPSMSPLKDDPNAFADIDLTPKSQQQQPQQQGGGLQQSMYGNQGQQQPQQQQQQTQQQASDVLGPIAASVSATIKTSKGDIHLTLFGEEAENTVRNFMTKAKTGYYKNLTFHRVEDWVIQGGDPAGNGTGGGQMRTEMNDLPFVVGSLGVARGANPQISNDSQFFITKTEASHLNNQYTNFGIVTKGMDVVKKIAIGDKILSITIEE